MNLGTLNPCGENFEEKMEQQLDEFLLRDPEAFFEFVDYCYDPCKKINETTIDLAREYGFMGNEKHARVDARIAQKVSELIELYG